MILNVFFSFIISFLLTLYLVPIFRSLALRLKFVDVPDGDIKRHKKATPYLGGVAIYCGFIASLALTFPFENNFFLFFLGATLLLFVGLIDDFVALKPYQKFSGQIIAALCFLKSGLHLKEQFFYHYWHIGVSFFWILLVVNAFNLVDVMDGLAALLATAAGGTFFCLACYFHHTNLMVLLASFLGAVVAFFLFNRPTASIYLGDAGSLFVGGFLSIIPFLFTWGVYTPYGYLSSLVILAIPLLEVGTLVIVRTWKGIPFYRATPDHFSLYLQKAGWSIPAILWYIGLLSLVLATVAFLFVTNFLSLLLLLALGLIFLFVWYLVLLKAKFF